MQKAIVIGGGLAGLTAANALAENGHKVTLIEQSAHLGGRARTQSENGYSFNLGPHALYRGGCAEQTLRRWKIPYSGGFPPAGKRGFFVRGETFYPMFAGLAGLAMTRMFNLREKLGAARLFSAFNSPRCEANETMKTWLDRHAGSSAVSAFAATVTRISTFATDLDRLSARAALHQISSALKYNVLYLDGGWQTLVDGLAARARALSVEIRCGEPVSRLDSHDASRIVLAVGPEVVRRLTGVAMPVCPAIHMASLELGLKGMRPDTPKVAFAVDRPLYFSEHSASARLAAGGNRLIYVAKYLGCSTQDPKAVRGELEDYATLVMPTWKQHVEAIRFMPELVVSPLMATTAPAPAAITFPDARIRIAGDWVGPEGMLADAAFSSGLAAAFI